VANGHSYGGGYKCAPLAKIDDESLDVCLVNTMSRFKILGLINSYKAGTHLEKDNIKKYITYRKCMKVKIKSDNPINLCIDGESYIYEDVDFEIVHNAFKFWIPKGSEVQNQEEINTYSVWWSFNLRIYCGRAQDPPLQRLYNLWV